MYRSTTLTLLLLICLCHSALAQRPFFKDKKVAQNIEKHVITLASPEMEGRYIATYGEKKSAEYIAQAFEEVGLRPAGDVGYMQEFAVPNLRMAQGESSLKIGNDVLTLFTDFYPISISANNGRYNDTAINLGFGIEDAGLKHNDYKNKDVSGKAVIIDLDIPGGMNPHNRFMSWADAEVRAEYAISKGAQIVLLYTTNPKLKPSGTLEKTLEHSGKPVVFVNKDLSKTTDEVIELNLQVMLLSLPAHNVAGYLDNKAEFTVLITAHFDHLGAGNNAKTQPQYKNLIHPGADNNASGTAALIEVASEVTRKSKKYAKYNYLFVALTGSEHGQLGAKRLQNSKAFGSVECAYGLSLDMVGGLDSSKTLQVLGTGTSASWESVLSNTRICKRKIKNIKSYYTIDEASNPFIYDFNGIPYLILTTGQKEYTNTPEDKPEVVNYGGAAFVIRYTKKIMKQLTKEGPLVYAKSTREASMHSNLKVELGILPNASFTGKGVQVAEVSSGSVAQRAGFLSGDIITQLAGQSVIDIHSYLEILASLNTEQLSDVSILRDGQSKILPLQF